MKTRLRSNSALPANSASHEEFILRKSTVSFNAVALIACAGVLLMGGMVFDAAFPGLLPAFSWIALPALVVAELLLGISVARGRFAAFAAACVILALGVVMIPSSTPAFGYVAVLLIFGVPMAWTLLAIFMAQKVPSALARQAALVALVAPAVFVFPFWALMIACWGTSSCL